jgi:hypothetical protein
MRTQQPNALGPSRLGPAGSSGSTVDHASPKKRNPATTVITKPVSLMAASRRMETTAHGPLRLD